MERKNAWEKYPQGEKRNEVFAFAEELSANAKQNVNVLHTFMI